MSVTDVSKPVMHPHFEGMKKDMWDAFLKRDYETSAKLSAMILQNSGALDAVHVAGLSLTHLDRVEEGFDWCCASLSLAKGGPDWFANAGLAFLDKKDFLHAMLFATNGLKEHPKDVRLTYIQGLCMCHAQDWNQAIAYFNAALDLDPQFYHATMSKGFCLHMLSRYDEAIDAYQSITNVGAAPADREEIVNNHACVLLELARPYEALELIDREYPDTQRAGTKYNRSFLLLGMGKWPEAWDLYRLRSTVQVKGDQGMPTVEQPIAQTLDDIKGRDLFFFHEQGLGDSIQFMRYARLLRPYVRGMTIGVPKGLRSTAEQLIMGQPFQVVSNVEPGDREVFSQCDIACPMVDGPALLRTTVDTIPGETPYFTVPEELLKLRALDASLGWSSKPRIGLAWAGATRMDNIRAHSIDKRRSIPFELLAPILRLSGTFNFVSLQLEDHRVNDARLVQPLHDSFDVLDTCAIIKQLDLVICIDSAVAHMAASLNTPTWMLSRFDGCWRWFYDGREETPWYPTMRIFQQKGHNTWPAVIERVVANLMEWRDGTK